METLLYFGKVILSSGVMFLYYRLFLKDKTFHHYNRFYLLSVLLVSLLLPLLKVSYFSLEVNKDIYLLINKIQSFNTENNSSHDFIYFKFAALFFGLVSVFFLAKLFYGLVKIQQFKKQFSKESFEGINFYQTNLQEAPFSFFRNLFWRDSIHLQSDLGRQILKHEMVHIEQKHSWDKIFTEIATSLFWFNPFFHFIKKEINLIHEYLADKKAVQNSDTKAFAQMLLASHFSGKQFPATSPFLSSNLKKRLTMLKKSKTKFSYARRIFALPLMFILGFIYMVNAKNKEIKETNKEIEKLVSDLKIENSSKATKHDTISPKKVEITSNPKIAEGNQIIILDSINGKIGYGKDGTALYSKHPELFINSENDLENLRKQIEEKQKEIEPLTNFQQLKGEEARKIGEELRKKGEEFRKLLKSKNFDDPKLKRVEKQMDELGRKMEGIFNSDAFLKNQKLLDGKFLDLDKLNSSLEKFYNSNEFKMKMRNLGLTFNGDGFENSEQFKEMMKNSEIAAKNAERIANGAEKAAKEAEKLVNSKEFKKQIEQAQKAAEVTEKNFSKSNMIFLNSSSGNDNEMKIYIDGKPVTKEEMEKLPPENISKMEVNKKGFHGNSNSEIRIYTKK
ncbi:M56 family metallopeptidase [Chryseobacterium sp. R2A-55]|uniref:M56 family metallopeptidase n=1 Tax=Chryseobacterium sp. R2A-55 TaxID=2744445 RepID=UPI001F43C5AC|nr:M56 family metallopeptidase [Chryseobacterium sp. R2A-55]